MLSAVLKFAFQVIQDKVSHLVAGIVFWHFCCCCRQFLSPFFSYIFFDTFRVLLQEETHSDEDDEDDDQEEEEADGVGLAQWLVSWFCWVENDIKTGLGKMDREWERNE